MTEQQGAAIPDPYRVKRGDMLSRIAARAGKSVQDLQRLNGIKDPNKLEVGRTLYLSEATAFGVSVSFLDALRQPIANLPFRLGFDGKVVTGKTTASGLIPQQVTQSAKTQVDVWVQNAHAEWQRVTSAASGYGHKLLTLVSDALVVKAQTEPHPTDAPARVDKPLPKPEQETGKPAPQPKPPPAPDGKASKNNPDVKQKPGKAAKGQSIVTIGVDIPKGLLDLFAKFESIGINEDEWTAIAKTLNCEVAVLKAFAEVESGGKSSFWRLNNGEGARIPAILYERHYFSKLTKGTHDKEHPDISWRVGYRKKANLGSNDDAMHDGKVDAEDVYSDFASSYLRLIKAFRLNPEAALRSCSWGKFQIMGDNFALCSAKDVDGFVTSVCTSEIKQIALVAEFIRNKPRVWKNPKNKSLGKEISLLDAVNTKDWAAIAFNYNGPGYKTYAYDSKLKSAYEKHSKIS